MALLRQITYKDKASYESRLGVTRHILHAHYIYWLFLISLNFENMYRAYFVEKSHNSGPRLSVTTHVLRQNGAGIRGRAQRVTPPQRQNRKQSPDNSWQTQGRWICAPGNTLQHPATHCNTLQHTATHCNTLQHTNPRTLNPCTSMCVFAL